jgi:class 3 adenylate cyclase/tetratricopeptide (TPR) repeat protein
MSDVRQWLESIGLGQYADAFEDNDIDTDLASDLGDQDLKDLGVASMGHRKLLVRAIGALQTGGPPTDSVAISLKPRPAPSDSAVARPPAQAERRQLTVMFCDLADSTALSTQLDPEDYRDVMRAYQDACAGIVTRYDGFVARYMGDGVLAYFGWPRSHEDDPERAVNAGLGIVAAVRGIARPKGEAEPLAARVGIATGSVIVGDIIGEGASQEAAATGETPNLAARLQQIAAPHSVVVSAATRSLLRELFAYESLGSHNLKGISQAVETWRVIGAKGADSRFEAVHGQLLSRLVGRDHELALLRDRWEQACNGEGQVLLLSGEAGIGKSRLTQALMEHAQEASHFRLRFQCSPYDANSALNPIIRQLERAARFQPGDTLDVRIGKLETLLRQSGQVGDESIALVANLLRLPYETRYPPLMLTPQQVKQRTLDVLADQVFLLADTRPVLFLFEDAHWIDPSSLELLSIIVSRIDAMRVLVAITQRPEWHAPFANLPHVALMQLNRLGRRQIAEIIFSIAATEVPEDLVQNIIERTDGIPLYVEEMTHSLVEAGFASTTSNASDIPDSLQSSLMARLDRLPVTAKELAQIASVIGREVPLALLIHVTSGVEANIAMALEDLFQSQLILKRGSSDEGRIVFRHALIRDAAYQSLLSSRRHDIHRRIAEALEAAFPQTVEFQPELVARHYAEAGEPGLAIPYWRRAGGRAADMVASREAVDHYENALMQLDLTAAGAERDRIELQFVLAKGVQLIAATGYASDEVRRNYDHARELSEAMNDADSLFTSTRGLWNCAYDRAELDHALQLADGLVRSCTGSGPVKVALAQRALGSVQLNRAAFDDAIVAFDRCIATTTDSALAVAVRDHGEAPQIIALQYKGWAKCIQGHLDEARALSQRSIEQARKIDHPLSLAFALQVRSIVHLLCREYELCRESAIENQAIAKEHDFVFYTAGSKVILGCALAHLERSGNGLDMASQGLHDWQLTGAALHVPSWAAFIADAALCIGDDKSAWAVADSGVTTAEANHDLIALAELQRLQGAIVICRGDTDAGHTHLKVALATAAQQGAHLFGLRAAVDLARLLGDQGEKDRVGEILAPILDGFTEGLDTVDVKDARTLLDRQA